MENHVKIVGWLWIILGALSILAAICGVTAVIGFDQVPNPRDANLVTAGILCGVLPGGILDILAGYGLLKFKNWARILSIIFAILNLLNIPFGTAVAIYTLVIMFNGEAKALFNGEVAPVEMDEVS
jgi:hypothetical protein